MTKARKTQDVNILAALARVAVFRGLRSDELAALAADCRIVRKAADEMVLAEGDEVSHCFIVIRGELRFYFLNPDGKRFLIRSFDVDECCGLTAGMGNWHYLGNLEAARDSTLLSLPITAIRALCATNSGFSGHLLEACFAYNRKLQETIKDLTFGALERLSRHLVRQVMDTGSLTDGKLSFVLSIRKSDLAAQLGITPETLSRMLSQLQKEGLVSVDGQRIVVHSLRGLVFISEGIKLE
jgi:CRP-like cAMP-binding protein